MSKSTASVHANDDLVQQMQQQSLLESSHEEDHDTDKDVEDDAKETRDAKSNKPKKKRHGARNQHRHKNMTKWIVHTFPQSIQQAKEVLIPAAGTIESAATHTKDTHHILDVAGGKGELSARLTLCHTLNVRMVDPRPADIYECFHKLVYRSLPKKWQQRINSQDPAAIQSVVHRRFSQFVKCFPMDGGETIQEIEQDEELKHAVEKSTLMIGMHADGATEAIVDIAIHYRKPFVVVPCCVFPNLFRHRQVPVWDDADPSVVLKMVPVRDHEQFCQYLALKDSHFHVEILPFEGRNTAIWWDGKELDGDVQ